MKRPFQAQFKLRDKAWRFPGLARAQRRLVSRDGIYGAFQSLEVVDLDAAIEYIDGPLKVIAKEADLDEVHYSQLVGVVLGFAVTMVEAEREKREAEMKT